MKRVVITEGDPAGIGREIIIKALADEKIRKKADPIIVGSAKDFDETFCSLIAKGMISSRFSLDFCDIFEKFEGPAGEVSAEAGLRSYNAVKKAVELIKDGVGASLCTAPINKQALRAAGVPYIGHTEMLAVLTDSKSPLTVFETGRLRIFFFPRHIPFADISKSIKAESLYTFIMSCDAANRELGSFEKPLAVAALNPHAGDRGLLGTEEKEIEKAVKSAAADGVNVVGPVPADSVFAECLGGKYSAVLSLYHDQGHIAAKTLDFDGTVSLTAGLPFLRTSPDHGTAFDIAGKGIARETAMKAAILRAAL